MRDGFLRVAAAVPTVNVADVESNVAAIIALVDEISGNGVEVAVFPEMCITGYTCGDLFHNETLLDAAAKGLGRLIEYSRQTDMAYIVGFPLRHDGSLYNCGAVIERGKCLLVPKAYIPNYNEFYERRWWQPAPLTPCYDLLTIEGHEVTFATNPCILTHGTEIGVEICEDLWCPVPPSSKLALAGAKVIFNLSASNDLIGKYNYLKSLVKQQSARCIAGYVYASAGYGESSTDLTFDGKGLIAENGTLLAEKPRWDTSSKYVIADIDIKAIERDRMHLTTFGDCARRNVAVDDCSTWVGSKGGDNADFPVDLMRCVDSRPFVPASDDAIDERCTEIVNIQAAGLCRRLEFIHCHNLVVGISGGLDSTLALLVAVKAFDRLGYDRKGIFGVTMPGFGTTSRTHDNAVELMEKLGVSMQEISIVPAVNQHFKDIDHDPGVHDVTYENSQARQRTLLLMDLANKVNGIVLGTGDLSELALGWATYNGDHMSMYGVNAGVPKTLVRYLVRWFALRADDETRRVLNDIIDTPISPELIPADAKGNISQITEDLVGPYELHDFFLYYMLRYGFTPRRVFNLALKAFEGREDFTPEVILHWLRTFYRRFFQQQFKRSCLPDGPKVGSVCLSPRGDWRMPSDTSASLWLKEVDSLSEK